LIKKTLLTIAQDDAALSVPAELAGAQVLVDVANSRSSEDKAGAGIARLSDVFASPTAVSGASSSISNAVADAPDVAVTCWEERGSYMVLAPGDPLFAPVLKRQEG
jgi:hypothetical protein